MKKKHILILGAGISGLSAAWYLSKVAPEYQVTILEKQHRAGGWIESIHDQGFLFEKGPRIFKASKSQALLGLIEELGLAKEVITSSASDRYIMSHGQMHKLPQGICSFLTSSYTRGMLFNLATEVLKKPSLIADESIEAFITRRFGSEVLDKLFDPLVQGIYAAAPSELSIQACFGRLKQLEQQHGSILLGFLRHMLDKPCALSSIVRPKALFSFRGGVNVLVNALVSQIPYPIEYGQQVQDVSMSEKGYVVNTLDRQWEADTIFCALPPTDAAAILQESAPEVARVLYSIPSSPITSILVGYHDDVLSYNGLGYLVSSKEGSPILGTVFDSKAFPGDRQDLLQTKMTVMVRGIGYSESAIHDLVDQAINKPLHIAHSPDFCQVITCKEAIPKYLVGHQNTINIAIDQLSQQLPNFLLLGNYIQGVSVSDCIRRAQETVLKYLN